MKTLKKSLSLVLALVLALSLFTGSFAAKNYDGYSDSDKVTKEEAAEVLNGTGIVDGYGDGSNRIAPEEEYTREQGAAVVARAILGREAADKLTAQADPFGDVAKDRWSAGYISFCVGRGIIDGVGGGNFAPTDPLTHYAAAKMVLCAVGYGTQGEFVGSTWSVEVAKLAFNKDVNIFDNISAVDMNSISSREEAMQIVFNGLIIPMVRYSSLLGGYTTSATYNEEGVDYGFLADQHGLYKKTVDEVFGRPTAYVWYKDGKVAGREAITEGLVGTAITDTYFDSADASYSKEVALGTIYSDLNITKAVDEENVHFIIDGYTAEENMESNNGKYLDTLGLASGDKTNKIGGNGTLVEAFIDEYYRADGKTTVTEVTIVVIHTYVGEIIDVVEAEGSKKAYVIVDDLNGKTGVVPVPDPVTLTFNTTKFEEGDIVLFNMAHNNNARNPEYTIKTMGLAPVVEDVEVTKIVWETGKVDGKSFDAGDKTYNHSEMADKSKPADTGKNFNIYLDEYGYAIYVDGIGGGSRFAVILDNGWDHNRVGSGMNYYAKLLLTDGTVVDEAKVVKLTSDVDAREMVNGTKDIAASKFSEENKDKYDSNYDPYNDFNTSVANGYEFGYNFLNLPKFAIVKYTVNSKDEYTLTYSAVDSTEFPLDYADNNSFGNIADEFLYGLVEITKGTAKMTLGAYEGFRGNMVNNEVYGNAKTVYLIQNGKTYDVYVGYENVPSHIQLLIDEQDYYGATGSYFIDGSIAKVVFLTDVGSIYKDRVFILNNWDQTIQEGGKKDYYVYPAIINGSNGTIRLNKKLSDTVYAEDAFVLLDQLVYSDSDLNVVNINSSHYMSNTATYRNTVYDKYVIGQVSADMTSSRTFVEIEGSKYTLASARKFFEIDSKWEKILGNTGYNKFKKDVYVVALLKDNEVVELVLLPEDYLELTYIRIDVNNGWDADAQRLVLGAGSGSAKTYNLGRDYAPGSGVITFGIPTADYNALNNPRFSINDYVAFTGDNYGTVVYADDWQVRDGDPIVVPAYKQVTVKGLAVDQTLTVNAVVGQPKVLANDLSVYGTGANQYIYLTAYNVSENYKLDWAMSNNVLFYDHSVVEGVYGSPTLDNPSQDNVFELAMNSVTIKNLDVLAKATINDTSVIGTFTVQGTGNDITVLVPASIDGSAVITYATKAGSGANFAEDIVKTAQSLPNNGTVIAPGLMSLSMNAKNVTSADGFITIAAPFYSDATATTIAVTHVFYGNTVYFNVANSNSGGSYNHAAFEIDVLADNVATAPIKYAANAITGATAIATYNFEGNVTTYTRAVEFGIFA